MYENYMQNLMGVPMRQYQNTYDDQNFKPYCNFCEPLYQRYENKSAMTVNDLEKCYPEIYKVVYPMVKKACMSNTMPLNQTIIDNMVNEISSNLEANSTIELNITLNNELNQNRVAKDVKQNKHEGETRSLDSESRQNTKNPFINDLIRILIIRELLGRMGNRPPFLPNRPGPRSAFPGGRPLMPRYDIIENENYYYDQGIDNGYMGYYMK